MGGSINVAIRYDDGTLWSANAHTNYLPTLTKEIVTSDDPAAICRSYVGHFTAPANPAGLCPSGYGLVVFDLQAQRVLTMQGYSNLITETGFYAWMHRPNELLPPENDMRERFRSYHEKGRLCLEETTVVLCGDRPGTAGRFHIQSRRRRSSTEWESFDAFVAAAYESAFFQRQHDDPGPIVTGEMLVDPAPWQIEYFEEDASGAKAFKEALERGGFAITLGEEAAWATWIAHRSSDEEA